MKFSQTKEWKERSLFLRKSRGKCEWFGCDVSDIKLLQVHHLDFDFGQYKLEWDEDRTIKKDVQSLYVDYLTTDNVLVLCKRHHFLIHKGKNACPNCGKPKLSYLNQCYECLIENHGRCERCQKKVISRAHDSLCDDCFDEMAEIMNSGPMKKFSVNNPKPLKKSSVRK